MAIVLSSRIINVTMQSAYEFIYITHNKSLMTSSDLILSSNTVGKLMLHTLTLICQEMSRKLKSGS